jgi:hypothetical protein
MVGGGWVEHKPIVGLGALLGPEKTSRVWLGCVLGWSAPGWGHLTPAVLWVVVFGWLGVWLFVECCIVDASILLW